MIRIFGPLFLCVALIWWAVQTPDRVRAGSSICAAAQRLGPSLRSTSRAEGVRSAAPSDLEPLRRELRSYYVADLFVVGVSVRRVQSWIEKKFVGLQCVPRTDLIEIRAPRKTHRAIEELLESKRRAVRRSVHRSYSIADVVEDLCTLDRLEEIWWPTVSRGGRVASDPACEIDEFVWLIAALFDDVVLVEVSDNDLVVLAEPTIQSDVRRFVRQYRESVASSLEKARARPPYQHRRDTARIND